jgi:predicted amidophosphoribosyltransferase
MVDQFDFYAEKKFCARCRDYVPYLASLSRSYCAVCGNPVNLFSKEDWQSFRKRIAKPEAKKTTFLAKGNGKHRPPAENN